MKTVYWDMSELSPNSGVFGISSSEVNVVPAGTTFRGMSPRTREQTPQYGEIEILGSEPKLRSAAEMVLMCEPVSGRR